MSRQSSGQLSSGSGPGGPSSAGGAAYAWQPPAGSTIGAASVAPEGVLVFCTGTTRQLCVLLLAPPAAGSSGTGSGGSGGSSGACVEEQRPLLPQLVLGARLHMGVEVSCASNLLPLPRHDGQAPGQQRSAIFAVGTYASQVLLLQLSWHPQQAQHASLAVLQQIDLTAGSITGSLPDAAAAAAATAAAAAAAASPLSPRAVQRQQMTPESLLLLPQQCHSGGCYGPSQKSSGGSGGLPSAGQAGWGEAAGAGAGAEAPSLLVGLRTGIMLQLKVSLQGRQGQQAQAWEAGRAQEADVLALSLGHMPVVLLPLPQQAPSSALSAAGAAPPAAVVLSDRVSLLHSSQTGAGAASSGADFGGGRVRCRPLGLAQVQSAAALLLDSGGLGSSSLMVDAAEAAAGGPEAEEVAGLAEHTQQAQQVQPFLLCAAADGCLRMVSLDPLQLANSRCWPLPQRLQPSRLAVHAASGSVLVAGSVPAVPFEAGWDEEEEGPAETAVLQVIDPATGELLCT